MKEEIAVDLDGTLAHYDGYSEDIGKPIPAMMSRVKGWLKDGHSVVIFSARAKTEREKSQIRQWLEENDLPALEVTNIKKHTFRKIFDDRAVQVERNTGRLIGQRKPDRRRLHLSR